MNEFYEILKTIRNETGLSQKDFANKIGMKPAAYNMIESGKNQPSYSLLTTIISVFKIDGNRLFVKNLSTGGDSIFQSKVKTLSETEFLNQVHDYIRKINYLYQKLIDIRILLFQELKLNGLFATEAEADLLNKLTRPESKEVDGETLFMYPYENLNKEKKADYLQELDACTILFTNTFFECFEQLYRAIKIPEGKDLRTKFLSDRGKITDNWKYTHYIK
jgi:transcriptional regulator with XRE-family HTH domain